MKEHADCGMYHVMHGGAPRRTAVLALALVCMSARDAHAYTDPGSGVLLWQMGVAAVLGALFYVRRATKWLKERFGGRGLDEPHS